MTVWNTACKSTFYISPKYIYESISKHSGCVCAQGIQRVHAFQQIIRYVRQIKKQEIKLLCVVTICENCMNITLHANMMANIPVGQKQHRQERTAGAIQSRGRGAVVTNTGVTTGCVT